MRISRLIEVLKGMEEAHGDLWIFPMAQDEPNLTVYPREPKVRIVNDMNGCPMAVIG